MSAVPVNYWAVIVSGLASVVLGFAWYGPVFGKKWMALSGIVMPTEKPKFTVMIKPMVISVIGAIFMAAVMNRILFVGNAYFAMAGIKAALGATLMCWFGFILPGYMNSVAWENKSWTLLAINAGYWLVLLSIISAILTYWA